MLRKLLKHEFKATARVIPLTYLAILTCFLILCGFIIINNEFLNSIAMILNILAFTATYAIVIVTGILLIIRYYRSMYGGEGYLTQSIPVKGHTLVIAKSIVSVVWMLVTSIVCIVSFLAFLWTTLKLSGMEEMSFGMYLAVIEELFKEIMVDGEAVEICLWLLASGLAGILQMVGVVIFSITVGSCSKLQRMGAGAPILLYFGCDFVTQIITLFSFATLNSMQAACYSVTAEIMMASVDEVTLYIAQSCIISLILAAVYFTVSCIVADKHTSLK